MSMARMRDRYREEVVPDLEDRFGIENPMRMPALEKIVVNMGVGEAVVNSRALDGAMEDLARITGQKAQLRRARKSIAGFKIREGMPVGARVTLRGERMWEFLDRFISIALPRVRDFRGVSPASFDGRGNYAIGLREQVIFPEISYDSIDATRGLDVAVVTTTESDEEARELLRLLGMSFRDSREVGYDEDGFAGKAAETAEVPGPGVQPVPAVRPGTRVLPEVRAVQDLPQGARPRGQDPRGNESELVGKDVG